MLKLAALIAILAPLVGSLVAGLGAKRIGPRGAHTVTIVGMVVALFASVWLFFHTVILGQTFYGPVYTWAVSGRYHFEMGLMLDNLTAAVMVVVCFVSLLVHIYSVGYMRGDGGYARFFSYVSLFTFMMLLLVSANNFFQLFFGWEGVGLVSYLLIGFWFHKDSAASGSLKAFLVNRVGDFGFIIGIAAVLSVTGSLDYATVFSSLGAIATQSTVLVGQPITMVTLICVLLFIGAMGKSAQVPLHVWLPESMEGPTPISALIHAATMVTAGVFMVARLAPLFSLSTTAMSLVLVVGATGALFLGLLAFVENDIKRVIAYSTMSQLGYMMAANGASAFSAAIFHMMTHACFKSLLFLAAGSVIVAVHHNQDMRQMGGLKKHLPVTYWCFLVGACALAAVPPFSGFFSKETVIEAVHLSVIPGAHYAYVCLLLGSFVTAFYIFRALFLTFHGESRLPARAQGDIREHAVMVMPLVVLAVPSLLLGGLWLKAAVMSQPAALVSSLSPQPAYQVLRELALTFPGVWGTIVHAFVTWPFWLSMAGIATAWLTCLAQPQLADMTATRCVWVKRALVNQYGLDTFNDWVFVRGVKRMADFLFYYTDLKVIDGRMVDGSGRSVVSVARVVRRIQTGCLHHYVIIMILGLVALLAWMIL